MAARLWEEIYEKGVVYVPLARAIQTDVVSSSVHFRLTFGPYPPSFLSVLLWQSCLNSQGPLVKHYQESGLRPLSLKPPPTRACCSTYSSLSRHTSSHLTWNDPWCSNANCNIFIFKKKNYSSNIFKNIAK